MTTTELANATQIHPELLLQLLDAGIFCGVVRLVRGQPMYRPQAVDIVQEAVELADNAAAGTISATDAWLRLRSR
jgi:hypothetical protein